MPCTERRAWLGQTLESKHWSRPSAQSKVLGISGAISFKMPLEIHEQLAAFASIVQREMWNQGTSDSFYPPDVRHREHFIITTGSTGINLQPITTANIITFSNFSNSYFTRTERFPHRHQTAGCGPQASRGRMLFLNHRSCLQRIRRACHTQSERVHTLFSKADSIRDYRVGGHFNQNRFSQSSYRISTIRFTDTRGISTPLAIDIFG